MVLWASAAKAKLPKGTRNLLESGDHTLWVSAVTFCEIAVRQSLNKSDFRSAVAPLRAGLLRNGFLESTMDGAHALELSRLAMYHTDPFDRLLVAQAKAEGMIRGGEATPPHCKDGEGLCKGLGGGARKGGFSQSAALRIDPSITFAGFLSPPLSRS
jgi:PIN domain nuclease of toxin-antitoxin system